ncbi:MAG: class I SAM-dependent methyltransferase, partial [Solirubrobacteraceae bacterium]
RGTVCLVDREGWLPTDQAGFDELRDEVESSQWYHTFELAPGIETAGWFDLRELLPTMPFPHSLAGKRCLDVGTFDGFWAFEMERRGGEVVAIDILDPAQWDWPAGSEDATHLAIGERKRSGAGFELISKIYGTNVERRELSIYDLDPVDIGTFDLVYVGSLLLHLRDPVMALSRVKDVCSGALILCDAISPLYSLISEPIASLDGNGRPWWWRPNVRGLERMVEAAGFTRTAKTRPVWMKAGRGRPAPQISRAALRTRTGRRELFAARFGDPHAVIQARV